MRREYFIALASFGLLVLGGVSYFLSTSATLEKEHPPQENPFVDEWEYDKKEEGEVAGETDEKFEVDVYEEADIAENEGQSDVGGPGEDEEEMSQEAGGSEGTVDAGSSSLPVPQPEEDSEPVYDPAEEFLYKNFTSIHELDEKQNAGRDYDFEEVNDGGRDLQSFVSYVAPQNSYLNRTVMGFAPYWALDGYYQNYQMEHLSVIAYFGVTCYPDGTLVKTDSGWSAWNSTALARMVNEAHDNGVKVVLTVKNFDRASIETLISSSTYRSRLVNNILAEVAAKDVDGVNIDFEHIPVSTPVSSTYRARFASFVDQVADAVHAARPGSHASVDILATSGLNHLIYDVAAIGASSVDSIMVMSYDFHSTSYYAGKKAGPESPLYGDQYWYTVARSMNDIAAQAPKHKVIMGVPYYGLEYPVSSSTWLTKNGTLVSSGAITTYANVMDPIFDDWHNSSTIQWDDGEKMTWYRYRWPSATTGPEYWQGYYDDPKSLGAKYDYVIEKGLGGIGIWALGYDDGRTELWNTIRDKFSKEPIHVMFKPGLIRTQQLSIHNALGAEVVRLLVDPNAVIVRPVTKKSVQLIADYERRSEVKGADFLGNRYLWK